MKHTIKKQRNIFIIMMLMLLTTVGCKKEQYITPTITHKAFFIRGSAVDTAYLNFFDNPPLIEYKTYYVTKGDILSIYGSTNGQIYIDGSRVKCDTIVYPDITIDSVFYPSHNVGLFFKIKN